jgi:hypothetical protein
MENYSTIERRLVPERRQYSLNTLMLAIRLPRRMHGRRSEDRSYPVLDRFDSGVVTLAIALMILSIMDSVFTLTLISRGGSEVNPVMNYLLHHSLWAFTGFKMLMTAVPAIVLVATSNLMVFNRWRARSILATMVGLYMGLIVYELSLLSIS